MRLSRASHLTHCPSPQTHKQKHMFSHHIRSTGRAFGSWHEFGLTLPSNTVAPQSLADILE